jgi:hypothetical protein
MDVLHPVARQKHLFRLKLTEVLDAPSSVKYPQRNTQ